jgi:hypothetical protein
MKANKALKRLAKIERLMSEVAKRFSTSGPHLRETLNDLKAAVARVKEAVTEHAASAAAKKKPVSPGKKAVVAKQVAAKHSKAKAAKKRAPAKKAARKSAAKKAARSYQPRFETAVQDTLVQSAEG